MRSRLITAALAIPLVFIALYLGGPVFFIFMALYSWGAMGEFARMLGLSSPAGAAVGGAIVLPFYLNLYFNFLPWDVYALLYLIISAAALFVLGFTRFTFAQATGLIFGGAYITVLASTLALIRGMEQGLYLTLAVFLVTWGTDTFAYFSGKLLGKRKLCPSISPGKTWAGALGGFGGGIIIATVIGILIKGDLLLFFLWGVAAAALGQVGDLCESAFKRHAGVKDSGKFFPGHGGFLDRIDSLLFVSGLAYIFFRVGL
jgi:phosphatidate cytidylyltransferase